MSEKCYKCLECGRVFPRKTPHSHGRQFRKHKIPWEEVEMPKSYAALEAEVVQLKELLVLADEMAKCARTTREITASMMRSMVDMDIDCAAVIDNLDVGNVDGFGVKIDAAIQAYDKAREGKGGE